MVPQPSLHHNTPEAAGLPIASAVGIIVRENLPPVVLP